MKRSIRVLSLTLALAVAFFVQAVFAHPNHAASISNKELVSLIASAETPAQHRRIAQYYEAKAQDYLAQSKEHEEQGDAYKKNPMTSASKFKTATVDHCDYFVQSFKDDAAKMQELAQMHEDMAKDAEKK